uniref:Uncharacterized protein n=1 Tax=Chromera velia CCMP2878 TaxID=1169474 RepID=A0A0G4HUL5_9ALVE|eukprot:Cvel_8662.t1-p1 / transcript=Cvel_8662.t1 / gene=Cvel_8662 / organism=Chromera_velia_CCMP2878 / gene_product=hypothetical protein / transcript_product=hypothetical protein / location=Cvel_scaffold483:30797-32210(-) / protein_length=315 / sequence_SO=supercontig / SO=protein_coding / is_pseudo=false
MGAETVEYLEWEVDVFSPNKEASHPSKSLPDEAYLLHRWTLGELGGAPRMDVCVSLEFWKSSRGNQSEQKRCFVEAVSAFVWSCCDSRSCGVRAAFGGAEKMAPKHAKRKGGAPPDPHLEGEEGFDIPLYLSRFLLTEPTLKRSTVCALFANLGIDVGMAIKLLGDPAVGPHLTSCVLAAFSRDYFCKAHLSRGEKQFSIARVTVLPEKKSTGSELSFFAMQPQPFRRRSRTFWDRWGTLWCRGAVSCKVLQELITKETGGDAGPVGGEGGWRVRSAARGIGSTRGHRRNICVGTWRKFWRKREGGQQGFGGATQ